MSVPSPVAVLGAGTIGSGWAALFAAHGAAVRLWDAADAALPRTLRALACAREIIGVGEAGTITRASTAVDAVAGAAWVQESLPESLALKREVLASVAGVLASHAVVASSTSSLTASALGEGLALAPQLLLAHPLDPVYAVPVVEVCGGRDTTPATIARAMGALRALGREPLLVQREIPGLVANRLTDALIREAESLIAQGAIDGEALDRLVARGIATGWIIVGPLATERIGQRSGDLTAHAANECAWARTLARLLRAAGAFPTSLES